MTDSSSKTSTPVLDAVDPAAGADAYQHALDRLLVAARLVASVDVAKMRQILEAAHATAPILDPSGYRGALADGSLDEQTAVVEAFASTLGIGEVLDRIDGRYDYEGTAGVAVAAATMLRIGRGDRPT